LELVSSPWFDAVGWDSLADVSFTTAAIFPGQAILFSRMMDVFTLTGEAMKDRGNFFASMFIVLAAGCLVIYFVLGWSVNVIAQVCGPPHR
jgi:hypothetical protein